MDRVFKCQSAEAKLSTVITIIVLTITLALNALYVAAEFATVGSRSSRIQALAQDGNKAASKLLGILRDPAALDNYVAACQIGITLSSLVAGAFAQARLTPLFEPIFGSGSQVAAIIITLLIITSLQVILGELLPKTAALRYPERLAIATLAPMQISRILFYPLVKVFNGSAFAIMRGLGLNVDHSHAHVHSPEELAALFDESAAGGLIDVSERDMVAGVFHVEHRLVREIMTPRRRIVGVEAAITVADALDSIIETPHTRFMVWGESVDDVVGIVDLRELFVNTEQNPQLTVGAIARPVLEVAETMTVPMLWRKLNDSESHCALVIDEYGGLAGLVTLEDAIEEIFGELRDEFDVGPDPVVMVDGRLSVSGEVLVEDLNEKFGLDLPEEDVDTIGGLIWHELSRPPVAGEDLALGTSGTVVRVDSIDGNAVTRVSLDLGEQR